MSEGGWGALEIIIVLVLVIALLGRVFGTGTDKGAVPDIATYKPGSETAAPSFNECGKLLVTAPKPSERVAVNSSGITVRGSSTLCDNIIAVTPETFTVTVVDAYARPVSETVTVGSVVSKGVMTFAQYVPLTETPRAGTGYVLVTRVSNLGVQLPDEGARIPVRFVNQ